MCITKRYTVNVCVLCLDLILFLASFFGTRKMLKGYPDTHIKVLTKEHFNNRCLHSENNNPRKYPNGTLERETITSSCCSLEFWVGCRNIVRRGEAAFRAEFLSLRTPSLGFLSASCRDSSALLPRHPEILVPEKPFLPPASKCSGTWPENWRGNNSTILRYVQLFFTFGFHPHLWCWERFLDYK